jgi:hypothetical protein
MTCPHCGQDNCYEGWQCEKAPKPRAGYATVLTVHAKDGTHRDVAVCAEDDAVTIGGLVIDAIQGVRMFQLSTRVNR